MAEPGVASELRELAVALPHGGGGQGRGVRGDPSAALGASVVDRPGPRGLCQGEFPTVLGHVQKIRSPYLKVIAYSSVGFSFVLFHNIPLRCNSSA